MKVLVIGSGGREHAFAWKAAQSPLVSEVLVAPGNAGTAGEPKTRNVAVAADDLDGLAELAQRESIGLTIVGPEQPLVAGVVDRFTAVGLKCFGPTAAAARLEGSKSYAKTFMRRHGIPTAAHASFDALAPALAYLEHRTPPVVVKADGLAAGKGVVVAPTLEDAERAVRDMLEDRAYGGAGERVVIEDCLVGEEASFIALVDGTTVLALATSQDHKRRDDGDRGPNTGGMGAYSPAPVVTPSLHRRIMEEIMLPTVRGLAADGIAYRGFLYAGLMIDDAGNPQVLEFNCRFGDPETQPILCRLGSDLVALCLAACDGRLDQVRAEWDPRAAVGVVMASRGYPGKYTRGAVIGGLEQAAEIADTRVFHAGTQVEDGRIVTAGGRVLCVCGLGATVGEARERSYRAVAQIEWDGAFYRKDIGYRAVARERGGS